MGATNTLDSIHYHLEKLVSVYMTFLKEPATWFTKFSSKKSIKRSALLNNVFLEFNLQPTYNFRAIPRAVFLLHLHIYLDNTNAYDHSKLENISQFSEQN